jgi:hypothetical protein
MSTDTYYLGGDQFALDTDEEKARLIHRLRQYLAVRNFGVLIGNGCSLPLGSPRVDTLVPVTADIDAPPYALTDQDRHKRARELLDRVIPDPRSIGVESLLTVLAHVQANEQVLHTVSSVGATPVPATDAYSLEALLKKWLYLKCAALSATSDDKLRAHEELLRRILLRSTTLPRAKIFTLNYDLILERALDNLGVHYFDGFLGTITRTLRTESYHYDLYYPGETTEGRVSRVDRVLHLYKLHGSINWRRHTTSPAGDVVIQHARPDEDEFGDVMIYPSPLKVTEMNGYPYAEMFRHFSAHIHQPQTVLLAIGYRFQDSHINRLIYQALSIPSFVLIIVTPTLAIPGLGDAGGLQHEIWRLKQLDSKRILIITGATKGAVGGYVSGAGTFQDFSTKWLPDITELNVDATAREEARKAISPEPTT